MPILARDSLTTYTIFILPLFLLAIIAAFNTLQHTKEEDETMATKPSNSNLNGVLGFDYSFFLVCGSSIALIYYCDFVLLYLLFLYAGKDVVNADNS